MGQLPPHTLKKGPRLNQVGGHTTRVPPVGIYTRSGPPTKPADNAKMDKIRVNIFSEDLTEWSPPLINQQQL